MIWRGLAVIDLLLCAGAFWLTTRHADQAWIAGDTLTFWTAVANAIASAALAWAVIEAMNAADADAAAGGNREPAIDRDRGEVTL